MLRHTLDTFNSVSIKFSFKNSHNFEMFHVLFQKAFKLEHIKSLVFISDPALIINEEGILNEIKAPDL